MMDPARSGAAVGSTSCCESKERAEANNAQNNSLVEFQTRRKSVSSRTIAGSDNHPIAEEIAVHASIEVTFGRAAGPAWTLQRDSVTANAMKLEAWPGGPIGYRDLGDNNGITGEGAGDQEADMCWKFAGIVHVHPVISIFNIG